MKEQLRYWTIKLMIIAMTTFVFEFYGVLKISQYLTTKMGLQLLIVTKLDILILILIIGNMVHTIFNRIVFPTRYMSDMKMANQIMENKKKIKEMANQIMEMENKIKKLEE